MCPHGYSRALLVVATLVDSRCQPDIAGQMFYAVKTPEISKLAEDAAGYDTTYARNTFQ